MIDEDTQAEATIAAAAFMRALGLVENPSTKDTPRRWAAALIEMTDGLRHDPAEYLYRTFPPETDDPGMITVPGIRIASLCEHHMLPFTGTVTVSYVPNPGAEIVGLSKLARMVKGYAARPQVQERLGTDITGAIMRHLDAAGAGALIYSTHTCMTARGARADGAGMLTSHLAGNYKTDPQVRAEFLALSPHMC